MNTLPKQTDLLINSSYILLNLIYGAINETVPRKSPEGVLRKGCFEISQENTCRAVLV